MPHLQSNVHVLQWIFLSYLTRVPSHAPPLCLGTRRLPRTPFTLFAWILCDQRIQSSLGIQLVKTFLFWCPLSSPASLAVYTTVQQSKRLNQSCDRVWGRYFCRKQSKAVCSHLGGFEWDIREWSTGRFVQSMNSFKFFLQLNERTIPVFLHCFAS